MNKTPFWIMLAREGETTDGRYISAEKLTALAENYSPENYTALVRAGYDQKKYRVFLGEILSVKTEAENDQVCLYALIEPNESWFSFMPKEYLESVQIFPGLEITEKSHALGTQLVNGSVVGITLTEQPVIKNLEPLNKFMWMV
ncbi:Phage capsid scaffolding protein (GPO) serine peptidase [Serratia quinivorans]|uniref:GPO family capsid scaffolding protein n=1 Tax=Serratia quinivorans TaxID=137545 RepID=UPI00217846AE|nr:GPO family capsid scaffolding protein [Serratia quinivorans]CAI2062025.1 Phage capsid scaffolding protein (GPO) serine peptidase [Serratia quinivorans]